MRYLAWSDKNNKFYGQKLLSLDQRENVIASLLGTEYNIFETIQEYDLDGSISSCPIYMDFDGQDALDDARVCAQKITEILSVPPQIYFSGKKGVHLVIPYSILHPKCTNIAKCIIQENFGQYKSMDIQVYGGRRLWRVPNSYHVSGQRYKIPLSRAQLESMTLKEIHKLAKNPQPTIQVIQSDSAMEKLDQMVVLAIEKINERVAKYMDVELDLTEIPPCILEVIKHEAIEGNKHYTIFTVAKAFSLAGKDMEEGIIAMMQYDHWAIHSAHINQVFKSVYLNEAIYGFYCSDLLKTYCNEECIFCGERWPFK